MNASEADPKLPDAAPAEPSGAGDDPASPVKPARKRAPRKTAADKAAIEDSEPAATKPVRARRRVDADVLADADLSSPQPPLAAVPPAADEQVGGGEPPPAVGAEEPVPSGPTEAGGERTGPARRNRNRRRGRRGADRVREAGGLEETGAEQSPEGVRSAAPEVQPVRDPAPQAVEVFAEVLSGAYDAETAAPEAQAAEPDAEQPAKRVLAAEADAPKLQKVLAQAGVGSRRDLEQMVIEGRVTVNGEAAHTGQRVSFGDRIHVDGKPVRYRIAPPPPRVLAYHKPVGEVVTHDDPQQRPTVFRRLPRLPQGKWQSVGRLDINTEGLLLFTNSGELANQLMHPRFGVEREYAVRSLGVLEPEARTRLLEGIEIDGQRCGFKSIEDGGGEGVNHWYRVVITEGRNREVRRLFEAVGHAVSRLIRIRYGSVVLPRGLKRGVWVDLEGPDLRALRQLAGGPRASEVDSEGGGGGKRGRNRRGKGRSDRGPERGPERAPDRAADRGPDRGPRPNRADRPPRGPRAESGEGGAIPNPLQQTFDKRAIQQARQRRELPEDGPIPNPLQQTFDKRHIQQARAQPREIPEDGPIPNPLQQTYDKRFAQSPRGGKKGGGDPDRIPDPLQTAVGYIGADAFRRKSGGGGGRGRRSGGGGGGGAGGGGRPGGGGGGQRGPRGGRQR
jgi:23S rRNA pseudouridine2605 synthase